MLAVVFGLQNNMPKVSILMPTYNGAKYIAGAIESVLVQSYKDWELLIIVDGSSDNTVEIVNEYVAGDSRIKLIINDVNLRLPKTLNKGLALAHGKFIARIDDDDKWVCVDKLERQINFLEDNIDYGLVGTDFIIVKDEGETTFKTKKTDIEIRNVILSYNPFCHSSIVFKNDQSHNFNYNENLVYTEDWDLWLRIGQYYKMANLDFSGVRYLLRNGMSKKNTKFRQIKYHARIIKKYFTKYPHGLVAIMKLINYAIFY